MAGAAQARRPVAGRPAPTRATARRERCPACGALAEPRQLVCLSCGERLALEQKPTGGRPVLIAVSALAAVALICMVLVAQALIGGDDDASAPQPAAQRAAAQAPAVRSGPDAAQRAAQRKARQQVANAIPGWPADRAGWTVVLLGAADRTSAESFARELKDAGVDAGVISPEERPDTGTLWLVYTGIYPDQVAANTAATNLRLRYSGGYARFVPRAPSGAAPAQTPPG